MAITEGQHYYHYFGTRAEFDALVRAGQVVDGNFYFITDESNLYVGQNLYTGGHVEFVATFPANPSQGVIYVNSTTHETKVWTGSEWKVIIPAIETTLTNTTTATNLVTAKAIRDYVQGVNDGAVQDVTYDKLTQKFTVTYGDDTTSELSLENLITGASYNAANGNFTFTVANGEDIVVNTPKENFLQSADYDANTHILTMTLVDGTEVEVDLAELIDTYSVKNTATVNMTMVNNEISATVNVSAEAGNKLEAKVDGLYVAETDLSDYYTKAEVDAFTTWKAMA